MAKELFTIQRRPGWGAEIKVEIECDPLAIQPIKMGLAVRVAYAVGANLDGANLLGANLVGANLVGANLDGALIKDAKVKRLVAAIGRGDGYVFYGFEIEAGVKIMAGCRWFTVAEFRAHVASQYPDTAKATETLWILDAIERRAADLGVAS